MEEGGREKGTAKVGSADNTHNFLCGRKILSVEQQELVWNKKCDQEKKNGLSFYVSLSPVHVMGCGLCSGTLLSYIVLSCTVL